MLRWSVFSARVSGSLSEKTTPCSIHSTAWQCSVAAAVIRGVGHSSVLWVLKTQSLCRSSPYKHNHCTCSETVNLGTVWLFNPWQAECDKWVGRLRCAYKELQKFSPALRVAVPALLLVRLCEFAFGTDVIWKVWPEPLGLLQLLFDVIHLPWAKTEDGNEEDVF